MLDRGYVLCSFLFGYFGKSLPILGSAFRVLVSSRVLTYSDIPATLAANSAERKMHNGGTVPKDGNLLSRYEGPFHLAIWQWTYVTGETSMQHLQQS